MTLDSQWIRTLSEQPLIEISQLSYSIRDRVIFDHTDFSIQKGKVTAIMGPSGSGKTTLLRLIGAQLRPQSGSILIEGQDVNQLSRMALYQMRGRMGTLFQSGALFTDLSVFENVAFPLREHTDLPESIIRDLVLIKLEAVGLRGAHDLMPQQLSGGMNRRVALARAIALDPDIILYDEPFAGQDPISMGVLVRLIRLLNDALGLTSIVVSHDIHETVGIADYIYIISGGKVVGQGTPQQLNSAHNPYVQQFMRGLADGPVRFHYPAPDYRTELGLAGTGDQP